MAKKCRRTGKVNYRSEAEARRMLAYLAGHTGLNRRYHKVETHCFRCRHCPYWHLTSHEQYGQVGRVDIRTG